MLAKHRQQTFDDAVCSDLDLIAIRNLQLSRPGLNTDRPGFGRVTGVMIDGEPQIVLLHHAGHFGLQSQAQQAAIRSIGRHWWAM